MTLFKKVLDLLKKEEADDIVVFGGGVIMDYDIPKLKEMGVAEIFPPDTPTSEAIEFVRNLNVRS
jgi:methylmalonyl-CoA mutase C-terminal domain/subunit